MKLPFRNTHLFYNSYGSGPAVVLLHGFLESASMWDFFIAEFSKKYTIITIDLLGHGSSGSVGEVHSMELMAEAVHTVIEQLKLQSFELVGHSMGGYVALAYIEKYSQLVSKITLINSTPSEDSEERKENRTRALKVIRTNKEAFVSMAISNLFSPNDRVDYASEIKFLKKEALQISKESIAATIKGMRDRNDRSTILRKFNKPKNMLCGTQDLIVPFLEAKQIATYCNCTLITLSGGHMSWIENKEELINFYS